MFIILYWVITLVLLNFILINSVKVFLTVSGLDPNFENVITIKWLSPLQYLDGILFGLFFILVLMLSRKLRIERFGFGKSILINSGIFLAGFALATFLMDSLMKLFEIYSGEKRISPGNRIEKLSGNLSGKYNIRINTQWRVVFRWENDNAFDVEILDYH